LKTYYIVRLRSVFLLTVVLLGVYVNKGLIWKWP
jgi:hypothetical protein